MEIEIWHSDECLLIGDVVEIDGSFDHAFGVERARSIELKDFHVIVYIGNFDYDLTKGFEPKELDYFKEFFLDKVRSYEDNIYEPNY